MKTKVQLRKLDNPFTDELFAEVAGKVLSAAHVAVGAALRKAGHEHAADFAAVVMPSNQRLLLRALGPAIGQYLAWAFELGAAAATRAMESPDGLEIVEGERTVVTRWEDRGRVAEFVKVPISRGEVRAIMAESGQ